MVEGMMYFMNYDYRIKLKEELISELSIVKALFDKKMIDEEEFERISERVSKDPQYSDYIEKASDVAWTQLALIIETEIEEHGYHKSGKVIFNPTDKYGNVFCDVVIVSKNNIHALKIVSMECDFIEPSESKEMMQIGYKTIDKYLSQTSSDTIDLIVIQPNLLISTGCRVKIDSLLDKFDNRLLQ